MDSAKPNPFFYINLTFVVAAVMFMVVVMVAGCAHGNKSTVKVGINCLVGTALRTGNDGYTRLGKCHLRAHSESPANKYVYTLIPKQSGKGTMTDAVIPYCFGG